MQMSSPKVVILKTLDWDEIANRDIELFSTAIILDKKTLRPQFPLIIEQTQIGFIKTMQLFVSDISANEYINNDLLFDAIADDFQ